MQINPEITPPPPHTQAQAYSKTHKQSHTIWITMPVRTYAEYIHYLTLKGPIFSTIKIKTLTHTWKLCLPANQVMHWVLCRAHDSLIYIPITTQTTVFKPVAMLRGHPGVSSDMWFVGMCPSQQEHCLYKMVSILETTFYFSTDWN